MITEHLSQVEREKFITKIQSILKNTIDDMIVSSECRDILFHHDTIIKLNSILTLWKGEQRQHQKKVEIELDPLSSSVNTMQDERPAISLNKKKRGS